MSVIVRAVPGAEARARVADLAAILVDCVAGGASVSFLAGLTPERAAEFWRGVAEGVAAGERILLVAEDTSTSRWIGTVQLILAQPENQPHRADVAKMLVHRDARRQGVGSRLMRAVDEAARAAGKTLLVLDTVTGSDAERLYEREGWVRVGVIPDYALWPDGRPCATTYFWKRLGESES